MDLQRDRHKNDFANRKSCVTRPEIKEDHNVWTQHLHMHKHTDNHSKRTNIPRVLVNVFFFERTVHVFLVLNTKKHPFKVGSGETLTHNMLLQNWKQ